MLHQKMQNVVHVIVSEYIEDVLASEPFVTSQSAIESGRGQSLSRGARQSSKSWVVSGV